MIVSNITLQQNMQKLYPASMFPFFLVSCNTKVNIEKEMDLALAVTMTSLFFDVNHY
jgi:hypothetical protein